MNIWTTTIAILHVLLLNNTKIQQMWNSEPTEKNHEKIVLVMEIIKDFLIIHNLLHALLKNTRQGRLKNKADDK